MTDNEIIKSMQCVIGNDVKLRLDVSLDKGTIDSIDSDITGNGKITIL